MRRCGTIGWLALVLPLAARIAFAQDAPAKGESAAREPRLLDRSPTDRLVLRSGETLRIKPLANRRAPTNPRPGESLTVELPEFPGELFEVAWRNIAELRLFEQQLLDEAQRLTAAGHRDEAFEYYQALRARYPTLEGLRQAVADFLAADADAALSAEQPDRALALLYEIRGENPDYPGLSERLGVATDRLVQRYLESDDLATARVFLGRLAAEYANHPVVERWNAELQARCQAELDRAAQRRAAGELPQALLAAQAGLRILPESAAAQALVAELTAAAGWTAVAVSSAPRVSDPASLDDWAARRISRLLAPGLYELAHYSREGGRYATRFGEGVPNELDFQLTLVLRRDLTLPPSGAPLLGGDVARRLVDRADPSSPDFHANWALVFQSVAVREVFEVDVRFRSSGLRPQALLQFPIRGEDEPASEAALASGYAASCRVERSTDDRWELVRFAPPADPGAPRRVTERRFDDPQQALEGLRRGEVGVIDRVAPWLVARIARDRRLAVEPYAVPTLCALIPNATRPWVSNRTFRRGLQYGIHRQAILETQLVRGPLTAGTQVISGPFPAESYGSASDIAPRDYEPYLAKTLIEVALAQLADQSPPRNEGEPIRLVISHPPHETARVACRGIKRQLERLGIAIVLVEQEPAEAHAQPDYDLRYAELFVAEPAVDAFRLFGPGGLADGASPYLQRAVRQLGFSSDWPTARRALQQIHRLVHEELALIPLWQIREHLARDRRIEGMGAQPVALYAGFDAWRVGPWSPGAPQ